MSLVTEQLLAQLSDSRVLFMYDCAMTDYQIAAKYPYQPLGLVQLEAALEVMVPHLIERGLLLTDGSRRVA